MMKLCMKILIKKKLTVAFRNQTVVTSQRSSLSLENAFTVDFRL